MARAPRWGPTEVLFTACIVTFVGMAVSSVVFARTTDPTLAGALVAVIGLLIARKADSKEDDDDRR